MVYIRVLPTQLSVGLNADNSRSLRFGWNSGDAL